MDKEIQGLTKDEHWEALVYTSKVALAMAATIAAGVLALEGLVRFFH